MMVILVMGRSLETYHILRVVDRADPGLTVVVHHKVDSQPRDHAPACLPKPNKALSSLT
jgi:hypothetical protein